MLNLLASLRDSQPITDNITPMTFPRHSKETKIRIRRAL